MWNIYKLNVLRACQSMQYKNNSAGFANYLALEYENALRRGGDRLNGVPILRGNRQLFVSIFLAGLTKGQNTISDSFNILAELSKALKAYWTGAQLAPLPNPTLKPAGWPMTIPAPGSIQNIAPGIPPNIVSNPGQPNPNPPKVAPTDKFNQNTNVFVNPFVNLAKQHLNTVGGVLNTTSLYPAVPAPIPAPGVIVWTGYSVMG
jgi:hypothetical protein